MGLRDYLRVAQRHWRLVVSSVLLALGAAFVVNIRTTPVYAARVTFFFSTPTDAASDLYPGSMFSANRLSTYAALLVSDEIAAPLAARPEVGLSTEDLRDRITAEPVADTVLLEVSVEDPSREHAMLIVGLLRDRFTATVAKLERPNEGDRPAVRVEVVDGPELDPDPVSPRQLNNYALAVMAGLIVGAGSSVVREVADHSVRTAESLQSLACVPVLARVPVDARAPRGGPFVSDNVSPRTEALRQVRTLLQSAAAERSLKTLAVTSAVPGEGRSATACSLALLFTEAGQRVLVVDTELRRPRLAAFLGRDAAADGLSSVLAGTISLEQAVQPWGAGLFLLAGGPPPRNPSELLSSPRMTEVVEEARRRYDVVIFDCPPLLPVTDGEVVAARADATLLVVRSRRTTAAQVTAAVRALNAVNASLLGCVLNMVPRADASPFFDEYTAAPPPPRHPDLKKRWWMPQEVAA
ncbi:MULTISPECIES: polysaccharide biosynthesis tyrosine autokinase [Actinoplanes]|uniref:polysaccharide biosynthesis tyrosine autokinase n=1 Tax=Actinoplanes TaxID=1865 RepID=UPI0005F27A20|nr:MULTISPECIES: polysaccharide biosynthesis tyrosine autokinase [Actinoplanes]GLY08576.1 hypothetical protein Acsp01_89550 [Actinoplanes sp. NBRC 101535]